MSKTQTIPITSITVQSHFQANKKTHNILLNNSIAISLTMWGSFFVENRSGSADSPLCCSPWASADLHHTRNPPQI